MPYQDPNNLPDATGLSQPAKESGGNLDTLALWTQRQWLENIIAIQAELRVHTIYLQNLGGPKDDPTMLRNDPNLLN